MFSSGQSRSLPVILFAALALAGNAATALGPYSYTGVNPYGPDWLVIDYPNVASTQTQRVTLDLHTGNALSQGGHWGIGLRGPSYDRTFPLGRGIAFGYLSGTTNAWCDGVAVENFTQNQLRRWNRSQHMPVVHVPAQHDLPDRGHCYIQ
jgi:hypothetical protein